MSRGRYNRAVGRFLAWLGLLALIAIGAAWYAGGGIHSFLSSSPAAEAPSGVPEWLADLQSPDPRSSKDAAARIQQLGADALPALRAALRARDHETRKAALRAIVLLEQQAGTLVPDVAAQLTDPELMEEAAMALSYLGPEAFAPLRKAAGSADPALRREAVRSIGKLASRAPIEASTITPLLAGAMKDPSYAVRTVAATYLGILHDNPRTAVPALIDGLEDPSIEVQRASAAALGSFGQEAKAAVPVLREAAGGEDPDLAREAGVALIKIQQSEG